MVIMVALCVSRAVMHGDAMMHCMAPGVSSAHLRQRIHAGDWDAVRSLACVSPVTSE